MVSHSYLRLHSPHSGRLAVPSAIRVPVAQATYHQLRMNIVILAAGQGKRMGPPPQPLPKVLHPIAGRPMLAHVVDAVQAAVAGSPANIVVVVGHGATKVQEAFLRRQRETPALRFVEQHEQLGTGHAVQQALPLLDESARTLVLFGDVPLISPATLRRLLDAPVEVGLLTVQLAQPTGYGRIVRDTLGQVLRVVEERDATDDE